MGEHEKLVHIILSLVMDNHEEGRYQKEEKIPHDFIQGMDVPVNLQRNGELYQPDFQKLKKLYCKHAKMHPNENPDETPVDPFLNSRWENYQEMVKDRSR